VAKTEHTNFPEKNSKGPKTLNHTSNSTGLSLCTRSTDHHSIFKNPSIQVHTNFPEKNPRIRKSKDLFVSLFVIAHMSQVFRQEKIELKVSFCSKKFFLFKFQHKAERVESSECGVRLGVFVCNFLLEFCRGFSC
jgi:hypothetical protein